MNKYILITFYPTSTTSAPKVWLVYGHIAPSVNEFLGEFDTQELALNEAFRHGAPVMLGISRQDIVERLSNAPQSAGTEKGT